MENNQLSRLVFNQPPKGKLQPEMAALYETVQCSAILCTLVFWYHQRRLTLFWTVTLQSFQIPRKNPHPGSEIVYTTLTHKVTQANPESLGKGSISRVRQVACFLLSCLKGPFFQMSQPDGCQLPCLDTIKK